MTDNIIVKPSVAAQFDSCMRQGRVLFFSAPCGFGKTSVAKILTQDKRTLCLSAESPDFAAAEKADWWQVLLIDDLQLMQEETDQQRLCDLMRKMPGRRFLLLSRGVPPGCLMAFQYVGLMTVLGPDDLLLDRDDIRRLLAACHVRASESEISGIAKESIGYPLGVAITAKNMQGGTPFSPEVVSRSFREVFRYFDSAIFRRFDLPLRRFLLELAPFEEFDTEMARMVSGDPRAAELLDWLLRNTTMMRYDGIARYHFWPQFRAFLLWEMEREYTPEKRKALFGRGGMYYELKEDYPHVLDCYTRSGDHSKVSELLIRNAELHPGMGHYAEMESYYRSLPESEIKASPALMQGMSMLCALAADYEGSERWYAELQHFADTCARQDAAGRQARSRLAWLDISLPQRGVDGLTETIPAVFRLMTDKKINLPSFSVTSTLPSIMNGGKDFSDWSRKDDLLYKTMRIPVEAVLGRDGVGLADCAIAESKFEKGEDISRRMLALISNMGEIQRKGTPDIEFAVTGLFARSQLANGQAAEAHRTVETLRARFAAAGQTRFLPNIDALLCRIDLHTGALDDADAWYREKAPRDPLHLNVMKRYQYQTQAMVELAAGRPDAALQTLAPLEPYCTACKRHIDGLHLHILQALACWRQKTDDWRAPLTAALDTAAAYGFIRPVSMYGAALLPLWETLQYKGGTDAWRRRLAMDLRTQAGCYPLFLQPRLEPEAELTAAELQILRLLCADKSNAEIGEIMHIKLTTVKTHVSRILAKLDVSRRSEAKTAAMRLHLI